MTMTPNWVIDYSLSLVNRTGAFYLSRDLRDAFSKEWIGIRRWRSHGNREYSIYERKIRAKLMLRELAKQKLGALLPEWPRHKGANYLHMDPLYCINDSLNEEDRVLCHDIGPISHPDLYSQSVRVMYHRAYQKILDAKPHLTFVSGATKAAFINRFGDDFPAMDVIPLYLRESLLKGNCNHSELAKPECLSEVGEKFFISVGEVGRRKGQEQSIKGYSRSRLFNDGIEYVICGPRGDGFDAVRAAAESTPGVHILPYVSDQALQWLYGKAIAFVLLSHLEGFGIPAIEAPLAGLLPIISHDPALVEATDGHAYMCDPYSVDEVAEVLRSVVEITESEKSDRIKLLRSHAGNYNFDNFNRSWKQVLGFQ
jgi:glycosyltransferase involved in cell wall biosynthesis